ncbi:MAG TPA: ATP-grasp domain-containing protein [Gemmataceae bacterium]|nr:ATP-grasp domain-containing protein [Gemmataceae bacterium]
MPAPRVLILYNEPTLSAAHPDYQAEADVLNTVEAVESNLTAGGYTVSRLGVSTEPQALLDRLHSGRPDVIFNLFEGTATHGNTEAYVAGLLDWLGIPFTGSPPEALALARPKHLVKHLLRGANLPTPGFVVVEQLPTQAWTLGWPAIVKPALQDASVGLDQGSVVTEQQQLDVRVAQLLNAYGPPVLVEQFVRGRELNVGVVECPEFRTLPASEILFLDESPETWPILTYDAKWKDDSPACRLTPRRCPAELDSRLAERLAEQARQAFRLLGCRDYARVDFRVSAEGEPYILEVNPNPDFNPTAGLPAALAVAGIPHPQFTITLVENALRRSQARGATRSPYAIPSNPQ